MKKSKKLEPQSWESAHKWLSTLVADPTRDERPVLQCIQVRDGRAYATDAFVLGSTVCPEVCPSGTLLSASGAKGITPVLTTSPTAYPDVQAIVQRKLGQDLVINTEDLVDALKKVIALQSATAQINKSTLIIFNRETEIVYLYAEDYNGAAVSIVLSGHGRLYDSLPTLSGCWFDAAKWFKILKGWSKGKHGWPNAGGSPHTLIEFDVNRYADRWYSNAVHLSPATGDFENKPFGLVISHVTNGGYELASLAWEKAQSAQTAYDFKAKLKGSRTTWNHWKGQLDLNDLPLFQGVTPFELGKAPSKLERNNQEVKEILDQTKRVLHYRAMRNHPAMIPWYNLPHSEHPRIAEGKEETEQLIAAIKESQKP